MKKIDIDVFSDIVCPWCFIGMSQLDKALDELKGEVEATVTHHPFMLDASTPEGGVNLREWLRERFGGDPAPAWAQLEGAAARAGVDLKVSRQQMNYNTAKSHTLLRHAGDRTHELNKALFEAYFVKGENIDDDDTLVRIAKDSIGMDEATARGLLANANEINATYMAAQRGAMSGVTGVPFFVFNKRLATSGAQPPEALKQAIRQAAV
jgi:predicted DsbA family dithiol-disulfide isomerase